jgi:hypothetical protein
MMDALSVDEGELRAGRPVSEEGMDMNAEASVTGAIIDSWVEPSGNPNLATRLVLQVAPLGRPESLLIVEASASLVGDRGWLEDLGENLCHGSPVAAVGRFTMSGLLNATKLKLDR